MRRHGRLSGFIVMMLCVWSGQMTAHAQATLPAAFIGGWSHHGFSLEVTPLGMAYATYRTYTWCTTKGQGSCDLSRGSAIYAGGLWAASLTAKTGALLTGTIVASADSSLDGVALTLTRAPHDVLVLTIMQSRHANRLTLCGPQALPSVTTCGA